MSRPNCEFRRPRALLLRLCWAIRILPPAWSARSTSAPGNRAGASFVNLETAPFQAVAAYRGVRAVHLALATDYVGEPMRCQYGFWGHENTPDPQIVRRIRQILETIALS
jgi:hypothetical protein